MPRTGTVLEVECVRFGPTATAAPPRITRVRRYGRVHVVSCAPKRRPPTWCTAAGLWSKVPKAKGVWGRNRMSTPATANLIGITGIARRLVLDGHLSEPDARRA